MEIFRKTITRIDMDKQYLDLPNDTKREAFPSFQGARDIVFPVMLELAGTEVEVRCSSSRSGRLSFTKGWREIACNLRLKIGDEVVLHVDEQRKHILKVRSAS